MGTQRPTGKRNGPSATPRLLGVTLGALLAAAPLSARGAILSGTVTGPAGEPVENVDLDVEDFETGERFDNVSGVDDKTDAAGDYSMDIPVGVYRIEVEPPEATGLAPHVIARFELAGDEALDVQLQQGLRLAGTVTDGDLLGVDNVDLNVDDAATGIRIPTPGDDTDPAGFYEVTVAPGVYDLTYRPRVSTRLVAVTLREVRVESDTTVNVQLESGFSVAGTVRATGGGPVEGARVDLLDLATGENVPLVGGETSSDGAFEVVARPGRYGLTLAAPFDARLVGHVEVVDIDADRVGEYELRPGHGLAGVVRGSAGPVPGIDLDFLVHPDRRKLDVPSDRTDSQGKYRVVLPAGVYDIVAQIADGSDPVTTAGFVLAADETLDLVVDRGIAAAEVSLLPPFPNPSRGRATIEFVAPGFDGRATVRIYDVRGRLWRTLYDGPAPAGRRRILPWDGASDAGHPLASGVYFVELQIGNVRETKRYIIVH